MCKEIQLVIFHEKVVYRNSYLYAITELSTFAYRIESSRDKDIKLQSVYFSRTN